MAPEKTPLPAVEGWFSLDGEPHLLGDRCTSCGTYVFPPVSPFCPNPACEGAEFDRVPLSRTGRVWSYTTNRYQPPPPYMSAEPFVPYGIAAVELADEKLVVLGQVAGDPDGPDGGLHCGAEVELVLGDLYEDDEHRYLVWKWSPV
jgi:uncharacterized OB-fold protein